MLLRILTMTLDIPKKLYSLMSQNGSYLNMSGSTGLKVNMPGLATVMVMSGKRSSIEK